MGTEEQEPETDSQTIASTSAVPNATQAVAHSQDFFQTLNGQVCC